MNWKDSVANMTMLPAVGNSTGDARITLDTGTIWVWLDTVWIAPVEGAAVWGAIGGTLSNQTDLQNALNAKQNTLTIGNLTDVGTDGITITGGTGAVIGTGTAIAQHVADSTHNGYLSSSDWSTFNNKLDGNQSNYITNPDAEVDTSGWNLYNNAGRTVPASVVNQDITFTSALSGNAGNGVQITYVYNASFTSSSPNIVVLSSSNVQVQWNNGPTIANNPTATQLKAAWDAVPAALAVATTSITGTPTTRQYINGTVTLTNGGDASPINGTGGSVSGVTFTRSTINPIVGVASFDLGKIASNEQGQGVSTDFTINNLDKSSTLQVSFSYNGSSGITLGTSSDVRVFVYDVSNANLIPVTPLTTLAGPTGTIKTFVGVFHTTTSSNYRLILHIATTNATAWDLQLDNFIVNNQLNATAATQVPSLVLQTQPISGAVTDHMCVMWTDGAVRWVPATITGVAIPTFGTDQTQVGFATNISGLTADIYIGGSMDGFSFGPFTGFEQYIDNTAGGISPLPSPFTDLYVRVGKAISSTVLNIEVSAHVDEIANGSGVPIKGGLLTSSAVNDGTGDVVLSPGSNGNVLVAASGQTTGLQWAPAVVTGGGFTYTTASRTLAGTLTGDVTGSMTATTISAVTVTGKALTGFVSGAGTVTATDTILTAFNKVTGNITGKQTNVLAPANILVGNASSVATAVAVTGDITITTAGVTAIGANKVTNSQLAQMAAHTFKGNNTGSTANALDLTANQLSAELNSSIVNSSGVTGATVTDALNTLNQNVQEVFLSTLKNAGSVTANTTIPTWTTVSKDTLSGFNASTGVYTVQVAGDYLVAFTAATTTGTPLAQIYKNGTLVQTGTGSGVRTSASTMIPNCAVNDTITVALDSTLTLTSTSTDTTLNIEKLSGASSQVVNARYHSSTTTVTSALATITYTTKDFDTQSAAYSSGVYTIPSAGKYLIKASLSLTAATAAAGNNYDIIIRKNSAEIARNKYVVGAATQKPNTVVVDDLVSCAVNDTIDIQASAAGTTPSINASTTINFFYLNKVSN